MFPKRLVADADGEIEGYRKHQEDNFEGLDDTLEYSIKMAKQCNRLRIKLEMTPEAYATTTDIGVMIQDGSGEALYSSAFDNREHEATITASGTVKLVITGGFAVADDQRKTPITVDIDQLLTEPISIGVTGSPINFVPGIAIPLEYKVRKDLSSKPKDYHPVGCLHFRERHTHDEALCVPIDVN